MHTIVLSSLHERLQSLYEGKVLIDAFARAIKIAAYVIILIITKKLFIPIVFLSFFLNFCN